jgi:hypothetical protein
MIDRTALEQVAARHLAGMHSPSGVSLLLHLHGGARWTRPSAGTLTAREPESRSTIGFHTRWIAKKPS